MIYLASPYSHTDPKVRTARASAAAIVTARLIAEGRDVISPIAHGQPIEAVDPERTITDARWYEYGCALLRCCDAVMVLKIDGWKESKGVQLEIALAKELALPVEYFDPHQAGIRVE